MYYQVKQSKDVDAGFLKDILKLDQEVYPKELQGTLDSITSRYEANKESYLLLYDKELLIGYICFFPITSKLSDSIYAKDKIYDDNIKATDICEYSKGTPTDVYIISFAIAKNKRNGEAIRFLTNGFMAYIKSKVRDGYLIRNILSTSVSDSGTKLLKDLNFKVVKEIKNKYTLLDCKSEDLHSIHFHKSYKDDLLMMIPFTGWVEIQEESRDEEICNYYIDTLQEFAQYECHNNLAKTLKMTYLGKKDVCLIDDYDTKEVLGTQSAYLFLTTHVKTNLHILTLVLPNNQLSTTMLQDQVVSRNLFIYYNDNLVEIGDYIEKKYNLKKCGEAKSIVCLSNKPENPNEIKFMLAAEAYDGEYNLQYDNYYIDSAEMDILEKHNLSQHVYSKTYASDVAVVYINESFSTDFKKNLTYEDGTIFMVELAMFRNAAINRTNQKIVENLSDDGNVSLKVLEGLYKELGKTMAFWNNDNFYYHTAQNLADCINKSFKTEENFATYQKNQDFLENIINLKSAQSSNRENKILNAIVILLTLLQVIPVLITFIRWLGGNSQILGYLLITGASGISTVTIITIALITIRRNQKNRR